MEKDGFCIICGQLCYIEGSYCLRVLQLEGPEPKYPVNQAERLQNVNVGPLCETCEQKLTNAIEIFKTLVNNIYHMSG